MFSVVSNRCGNAAKLVARSKFYAAIAALIGVTGCAFEYRDDSGQRRVFGFGDFAVESEPGSEAAGTAVAVETIGLSFVGSGSDRTFSLGYIDYRAVVLRDDSIVLGNPSDISCYRDADCRQQSIDAFLTQYRGDQE